MGLDAAKEMVLCLKKAAEDWTYVKTTGDDLAATRDVAPILDVALKCLVDDVGKPGLTLVLGLLSGKLEEQVGHTEDFSTLVRDKDWAGLKLKWETKVSLLCFR